jgi:predicted nucleic acid-binding protein
MKRVFVDTNIIIDLIADRKPFSKFAIAIFSQAENKKVKLYTSSHSIATTHYLLKKFVEEKELRTILERLIAFLHIIGIDEDIIKKSLKSKHKDFEDSLQIMAANSIEKMDCIVTRNIKDFKGAEIRVLSPDELVQTFN